MLQLFGRPWADLKVDDVEAFLADTQEEGLLWEAKGTQQPHTHSVRKAVCGFSNALGGYFLIGAERAASGEWRLPGVQFHGEAGTWLSSAITSGLSPTPPFDVKVFDRGGDKKAVVVRVEPVAVPPCITADGIVFQRVSGQTLPVTDQRVLTELAERGGAARYQAEGKGLRAAGRILEEPGILTPLDSLLGIALCPVGGPADRAAVLFRESFGESLRGIVADSLQADPMARYPVLASIHQDAMRMWPTAQELGQGWTAAAYWDGAVAAVYSQQEAELSVAELVGRISHGWRSLAEVATLLQGVGDTHVVVIVNAEHAAQAKRAVPTEPARRWTASPTPQEDDIARVQRDIRRGFGEPAWEPGSGTGA